MKLYDSGVFLLNGTEIIPEKEADEELQEKKEIYKSGTISWDILQSHNTGSDKDNLKIKFDAITSHDLTYVGIIQTARASGVEKFPLPYVLTCCHNSLCAVGGTINEDDHVFGLTAAKKYGGIYLPPHMGVIHQYMRETMAGGGKMILGSDSHTRYGALGTMAVGEGGGDLVKQILITKKILAASAFPIDTLAKDKIVEKLTSAFENGIINGSGTNQPLGVFTASADGIPASRDVETGASAISADDLINMKMSLRPEYRSKAVWVMGTEVLKDVMKLKATDGRYLWQPAIALGEPATILGLPVIESEYAPTAKTAGSYVAVLGDFSHYWFAYWKGLDVTVLNEKYAGTNQIGFLGHTLADGQPTLPAAFARLAIKA